MFKEINQGEYFDGCKLTIKIFNYAINVKKV